MKDRQKQVERSRQSESANAAMLNHERGLPRLNVKTNASTAEIYLQGAQVTGFQKKGEPPVLFLSRLSQFSPGKPIRGGVPICFPWFGPREGTVTHGFARITEWEKTAEVAAPKGGTTLRFRLSESAARNGWPPFTCEYAVTVSDTLEMELIVTNHATGRSLEFENCLHSYFAVGDIRKVSVRGLELVHYLDKTNHGARRLGCAEPLRIEAETDRVYLDTAGTVEIHDEKLRRKIIVQKSGSASTVVWNPWTTKVMSDLGAEEYQQMICVESGNVGPNRLMLAPGKVARMKVIVRTEPLS
jgi:glucose-6-phosphate 1-epimerase